MKGGTLWLMPHHWGPSGRRQPHTRPRTQATAHMADQVRRVKPRTTPQGPLNKHTPRAHSVGTAPGGSSAYRLSGAEGDFSGGTLRRPVAGAHMGKQPPLLSWEVIKELLMSLETLVWKRFSAPPGLGRGGHVTRPALCGVSGLLLQRLKEPAILHVESLKPARKKQAASQDKRSTVTSKTAFQIKQPRPSALSGVSSRIFWAPASVLPQMEWQIFCL